MPKKRHKEKVSSFDDDQESGAESISKSSWAASYGDVVSVLLCFFIILSTTSNMNSKNVEKMKEAMSDETPQGKKKKQKSEDVMKKLKEMIKIKNLQKDITLVEELDGTKLIINDRLLFSSGGAKIMPENIQEIRAIIRSFFVIGLVIHARIPSCFISSLTDSKFSVVHITRGISLRPSSSLSAKANVIPSITGIFTSHKISEISLLFLKTPKPSSPSVPSNTV